MEEGKLSQAEAERLKLLARGDTTSLAINALMVFGAAAVSAGVLALNPSFETGAALGCALVLIGLVVTFRDSEQWRLLGTAATIIGALLLSGGIIGLFEGALIGTCLTVTLLFTLAALIRSSFLMALVPLAVAAALGSSTGYSHATYMLLVSEPTITILVFSLLAAAGYFASQRLSAPYEKLALVFARVSLLLVNFGFWVGSLWADYPGASWVHGDARSTPESWERWHAAGLHIPDYIFIVGWAILLVAVGIWGAYENRRWIVNTAVAFAAIHFYTQWFERLGAQPWTIILAGMTVVGVAAALWRYNAERTGTASPKLAA